MHGLFFLQSVIVASVIKIMSVELISALKPMFSQNNIQNIINDSKTL